MPGNVDARGGLARDIETLRLASKGIMAAGPQLGGLAMGIGNVLRGAPSPPMGKSAFRRGFESFPGAVESEAAMEQANRQAEEAGVSGPVRFATELLTPGLGELGALGGLAAKTAGFWPAMSRWVKPGAGKGPGFEHVQPEQAARMGELPDNTARFVGEPHPGPGGEPYSFSYARSGGESGYTMNVDPDTGNIDLVAAYRLPGSEGQGAVKDALRRAVRATEDTGGEITLDFYDMPGLRAHYERMGFDVYKTDPYNPKYDPEGVWKAEKPDYAYAKLRPEARAQYLERPPEGMQDPIRGGLGSNDAMVKGRLLEEDPRALAEMGTSAEQYPLDRGELPKLQQVTKDKLERLYDRRNIERVEAAMQEGTEQGGLVWYNLEPMRQSAIDTLGAEAGEEAFNRLALLLGATSPRANTRSNLRRASLGYYAGENELGFPLEGKGLLHELGPGLAQDVASGGLGIPDTYGHLASKIQRPHIERAMAGEAPDWLKQPKIASFSENLAGNWAPGTIDTHNALGVGWIQPGKTFNSNHYQLLEQFNAERAAALGMQPAQAQASLWMAFANTTGVEDPRIMMNIINDAIGDTAQAVGVTPKEAVEGFWKGRWPLYGVGGTVTVQQLMDQTTGEDQT